MHLLQLDQIIQVSGGIFPFDILFPAINKQPAPNELQAIAYTASNNCYFGSTNEINLLAHECAHLAQQYAK